MISFCYAHAYRLNRQAPLYPYRTTPLLFACQFRRAFGGLCIIAYISTIVYYAEYPSLCSSLPICLDRSLLELTGTVRRVLSLFSVFCILSAVDSLFPWLRSLREASSIQDVRV